MKTFLLLFFSFLAFFCFPQESERIRGTTPKNQNIPTEIIASHVANQNVFSLHPEILSAEQGVKFLIPTMKTLFNNVNQLPVVSEKFNHSAIKYHKDLTALLQFNFRLMGKIAGGFGPPLRGVPPSEIFIQTESVLEEALEKLKNDIQFQFSSKEEQTNWDKLPFELKSAIIKYILACQSTESILQLNCMPLQKHLKNLGTESYETVAQILQEPWQKRQTTDFEIIDALKFYDLSKLAFATRIMNDNLRSLIRFNGKNNITTDKIEIQSCYGKIGIFGKQKDTIAEDYFISVDLGGDDVYLNNCGSVMPVKNFHGLLIDYEGNDTYNGIFVNAGILGISHLIDFSGDDVYENSNSGIAFSLFGTSVLADFEGDDTYTSKYAFSQGAAIAGTSVLLDYKGNDQYYCRSYSQGYAGTLGCGLLLDILGDDIYKGASKHENNPDELGSFIQGASKGRWAEATDGQSLAGGYGILLDAGGTDSYFARSFSQGAAYYFGTGILNDLNGNDSYNALSHSQGYAAHFALGNFIDNQGDDNYNEKSDHSKITQIIAGGRDNSCGYFLDLKGDDIYYFGNRSIGIGDMRGLGCFYDQNGENKFFWVKNLSNQNSPSLGRSVSAFNPANEFRLFTEDLNWNTGLFLSQDSKNAFFEITDESQKPIQIQKNSAFNSNDQEISITLTDN